MKFYDQDKNEISSLSDFVEMYNNSYFIGEKRLVPGIRQSSKFVEDRIESLLNTDDWNRMDVINILAWKIGKIKHQDSENNNDIVFSKGWENADQCQIKLYNRSLDISQFVDYIVENKSRLKELAQTNSQKALNEMRDKSPKGIGTVYLITLLYFITGGEVPIYDKYAFLALSAITNKNIPGDFMSYNELPDKSQHKAFSLIMENQMKEYIEMLNQIFETEYQKTRNIDRALWVYGHSFDTKGEKK